MAKKLPVYELNIDDVNFDAITAISLVDYPAIEQDFMIFSAEDKNKYELAQQDIEKRIVTGPALIPNKMIYRRDARGGEYEVFFSEKVIEKISLQFFEQFKQKQITFQHEINVNDIIVFESWLIEDPKNDKATALGYNLPKGTWMVSMKINNDEVWDAIKSGEVNGFSIEAFLSQTLINASAEIEKEISEDEEIYNKIIEILKNIDEK